VTDAKDYAAITNAAQLKRLADRMLAEGKPIGFDTETGYYGPDFSKRALDHYHEKQFVVGFSFTNDPSWARYVPLHHDTGGNIDDVEAAWDAVRDMLTYGHIVSFHQKFERAGVLKSAGIDLGASGKVSDPMLGAYVLGEYYNKSWRTIVNLKELVNEIYGHKMTEIHELWPEGLTQAQERAIRFNVLEVTPQVVSYACEDAAWVLPLLNDVCVLAEKQYNFMYNLEHKIANMMVEVERYGVYTDWDGIEHAHAQAQTFAPRMELYVKEELGKLAGRDLSEMNLNSAPQKQKLLFGELGFTTTNVSKKTGKMSASKKSLEGLAKEYSAVRDLLEYGEVQNLSRRLKKWLVEYHDSVDGRVHANYNQVQVPGGRFAANEPAIQQLNAQPWFWATDAVKFDLEKDKAEIADYIKDKENGIDYWHGHFRDFLVAAPEHYLLTFDFSQAELRILAGLTQEPTLLNAFANDDDIHAATAATVFNISLDEVTKELRKRGKTTNFAIIYGQGPKATGEQLGISLHEAEELNKQYFSALPFVTSWYNEAKRGGFRNGYITSIFGRHVPIWELLSESRAIRSKGERVIVNSYCQGGVADYVKFIQLKARKALIDAGLWNNGVMLTMNQHDALTFECRNDIDPNKVREILQPVIILSPEDFPVLKGFPLFVADWEIGQKWGSSKKWPIDRRAIFEGEHWIVQPEDEFSSLTISLDVGTITAGAWTKFVGELKEDAGGTKLKIVTPEGEADLPFTANITESKVKQLKKILKEAELEVQ
jgi:DNA polymerase-1